LGLEKPVEIDKYFNPFTKKLVETKIKDSIEIAKNGNSFT